MEKIGFIGLGLMGSRMVRRLLQAGYTVTTWNRTPAKQQQSVADGAVAAPDLRHLCQQSDIIFLCVADSHAVTEIITSPTGLIHHLQSRHLVVDCSSIDPATTKILARQINQQGNAHWVDAPVSGGTAGAEQGTLVIMAGGRTEDINRLRPVMQPLSQKLTHMGPIGSGQVTKICNQLIVAANSLLISEAVSLAEHNQIDANLLATALAGRFADSLPLQILAPRMANRQHTPVQWKVDTLLKDLNNAAQLAQQTNTNTPMVSLASQLMHQHSAQGFGQLDLSTLILAHDAVPPT